MSNSRSKSDNISNSFQTSSLFWEIYNNNLNKLENICDKKLLVNDSKNINHDLVKFIDDYPPNSASHYAGCIPLSSLGNNVYDRVIVKSNHIWRSHKYAIPTQSPCFLRCYEELSRRN
mmetsp:Transcript_24778/g.22511  ORF Transcript_24778/g.22511 Transcript_24778/m.22511 type:complete len:118 (-) Transcript_24778:93-446(-)